MYEKEVSLEKLFKLETEIYCLINDKCFNINEEEEILKEIGGKRYEFRIWDPIKDLSNMVLNHHDKLYFKLTEDKGVFVIRKNPYLYVSQVGRYTPNDGEILLNEKIDEDIYLNVKEFEPKFDSIEEVDKLLDGKDIDLKKTIEKILTKDIGINQEMIVEVEDYGYDFSELNIDLFSDEFYNKLDEFKREGKWIYIHGVYATTEIGGVSDNIYEYELEDDFYEEIDPEDDYHDVYDCYYETVGINSCVCECDVRLNCNNDTGNMMSSYGIMIEESKIKFKKYNGDFPPSIETIDDLSEPVPELAIEMLLDIIEFKD